MGTEIMIKENIQPIWEKVFKNGPSEICGGQPFGPFLNTLSHLIVESTINVHNNILLS